MRPVTMTCPNPRCRLALSVPGRVGGQKVKCAGCGQVFVSPPPELPNRRRPANRPARRKAG
ncbi:hypothetical protein LCGC14_0284100 [marine sediment metagenome]|uniref:Zinc finger/thioredoxin putative domain-containing protein n=1 Tax=marine sediment metagenome TaxID=412755 RepID=A0A0F9TV37_9ZZZZ|nr:hypothetical protein [Phycisphaerae bacterium]HDZ43949.1 hypothetical protein [Phycisphaerae bacterium]